MARSRKQPRNLVQQFDFSAGMITDVAAELLPENAAPLIQNMLIDQAGRLYKMGGWQSYSTQIMTTGTPQGVYAVTYPSATNPSVVYAIESDHLYRFTSTTKTDVGALTFTSGQAPDSAFFVDKLVLTDALNLAAGWTSPAAPKKVTWDGTTATIAALGGSPPSARHCAIYKSRLALAGTAANPNRIYFSPVPNIESTWDTTNSFIDCDFSITGLCALRNMLLVFSQGHIERIIGDTPPPGSNMDRAQLANMGVTFHRSIAVWNDYCIFLNAAGVWITNGGPPVNLAEGRMASTFRGSPQLALGVYRDYLIVGDSYICHLPTRRWVKLEISHAASASMLCYANDPVSDQLYGVGSYTNGTVNQYPVMTFSHLWNPSASNKNTARSEALAASVKTRALGGATLNPKRVGMIHVTYDLADAASDNPTLTVNRISNFDYSLATGTSLGSLAETTVPTRARLVAAFERAGPQLSFSQSTATSSFKLYGYEAELTDLVPSYEAATA